ncbi:MAG: hypothetical protein A2840_01280 [Candidatus Buchananbacteria bacterium RIFCSPHIGHO2_01_FULL_47_11b]|uniref:UDP-N-acetylglucosamine--LPS N-acetylglucosamine transferase n=1 Tax=Candidatus Buchananbacteria bacterium RIFCSPHIGHO2_01_FULL_47_11b TaxID=1797537 RepID=A0A1G1Y5L2_9BACT|nr:MAG: hypothetical protein A2840_01280 [Candidatus Buchananbacteria bacterium RIFCSPHIGHO2_01_FULL_47_11b]
MSKRILIVHATGGMGHVTAAKAVTEVFQTEYRDVEVKNVNILDYANRFYRTVFVDGYNWLSTNEPALWGRLYKIFNNPSRQKLPTVLSQWAIEKRFITFIKEFKPDFIISTHPLPMHIISHSKRRDVIDIPSSMVLTDFGCHSYWVDSEVNFYFVATDDVAKCLVNYQVKREHIVVTGIPIEPKFTATIDRKKIAAANGFDPDKFTLLIVGGQFGYGEMVKIIRQVRTQRREAQIMVVAGRDTQLQAALDQTDITGDKNVKVFGFVSNMHELMTAADVIFSKAGGLTVSECMAKQLPMVIHKVIPGQEEDNVSYLAAKGAALRAGSIDEIISHIVTLAGDEKKLAEMKKSCAAISRPESARALAKFSYQHS